MNETLKRLIGIVKQVLNGSELPIKEEDLCENSRLREDIGLNSITMLMLVMSIEDEFDMVFPTDRRYDCLGDVIAAIEEA